VIESLDMIRDQLELNKEILEDIIPNNKGSTNYSQLNQTADG